MNTVDNILFRLAIVLCIIALVQILCFVVLALMQHKKQNTVVNNKKGEKLKSSAAVLVLAMAAGGGLTTVLLLACVLLVGCCGLITYFNISLIKELKKPVEKPVVAKPQPKPEPKLEPEPKPEPVPAGPSEEEEKIVASLVRETITFEEAHEAISDTVASHFVEIEKTVEEKKYLKKCIINIDVLSEQFASGDTVDLQTLKDKDLIPQKADYVKILARGVLDKSLKVEAQDFSVDAVKMIILTGGHAIKKI